MTGGERAYSALLPPGAGRRFGLRCVMTFRRPGVGRTEGGRVAGGEGFLGRLIHERVILGRPPLIPETHDRMLPSPTDCRRWTAPAADATVPQMVPLRPGA